LSDIRPLDLSRCASAQLVNLGAGTGRWLLPESRRLGLEHPLGIDINRAKVAHAQASGLPVYQADLTQLDPAVFPSVKVVVLDNVLEHLPTLDAIEVVFNKACAIASHAVYIRHPSFEHEEYLAGLGLKQYWTDWPGVHVTHVRIFEFVAMAARAGVHSFTVRALKRAVGSDDPTILPAGAPPNQHKRVRGPGTYGVYDAKTHGIKASVDFDRPVYFAHDAFFFLRADAPAVEYREDTDQAVARPHLVWPGRRAT
jgi:hypothetical protein